jgi:hypothetical protein
MLLNLLVSADRAKVEQRLPKALTYYLEVEAVTEDHAKQPSSSGTSTVRSFYQNCSPKKSAK